LIVKDQLPDTVRELAALPAALAPPGPLRFTSWSGRAYGFDRIGRRPELVSGNVRHHRRLAGCKGGVPCRSAQVSSRGHGMAAGST